MEPHRFLLNLTTAREGHPPMIIQPGAEVIITARSQLRVKIEALLVDAEIADRFAMRDLRIGTSSCYASSDEPINMGQWSTHPELLKRLLLVNEATLFDETKKRQVEGAIERLGKRPLLDLGTAQPTQNICLCVRNVGKEPAAFEGALVVFPVVCEFEECEELREQLTSAHDYVRARARPEELKAAVRWLSDMASEVAARIAGKAE